MAKSHVSLVMATYTYIKSSKEYEYCVWKHNKCAQVSHIMTILDMKTSNTLIHNHNCLMGTITFKVHHITLTSPTNMLTIILKAFWFFLLLYIFFAYFLFEHIMHGHIREREKKYTIMLSQKHHNFAIPENIDVIHDWWALVVRWLFMPFS